MIAYRGIPRWGLMAAIAMAVLGLMAVGMAISDDSSADIGDYQIESAGPMKAAPTATVFDDAGLGYAVQSDGTLMLVSVPSDAVNVVVPATVDDNGTVRAVGSIYAISSQWTSAFANHKLIKTVEFENSNVQSNLACLFYKCSGLTSVTLPDSWTGVTDVSYMFYNCSGLTDVSLPDTWTRVTSASGQFQECSGLTSVTLPDTWTGVTNTSYLFYDCSGLTSVTLPDTWKIVLESNYGFYGCGALKQITLTTLPTKIGADALYKTPTPIYVVGLTSDQIASINALAGVSSEKFAAVPTVTFDANGGDAIAPVQGLTVTLPTDATRAPIGTAADGTTYTLAYYEAADGTRYQPGETIELSGDMELTARWLATTVEPGPGALSGSAAVLVWVVPLLLVVGIVVTVIGMLVVRR